MVRAARQHRSHAVQRCGPQPPPSPSPFLLPFHERPALSAAPRPLHDAHMGRWMPTTTQGVAQRSAAARSASSQAAWLLLDPRSCSEDSITK